MRELLAENFQVAAGLGAIEAGLIVLRRVRDCPLD